MYLLCLYLLLSIYHIYYKELIFLKELIRKKNLQIVDERVVVHAATFSKAVGNEDRGWKTSGSSDDLMTITEMVGDGLQLVLGAVSIVAQNGVARNLGGTHTSGMANEVELGNGGGNNVLVDHNAWREILLDWFGALHFVGVETDTVELVGHNVDQLSAVRFEEVLDNWNLILHDILVLAIGDTIAVHEDAFGVLLAIGIVAFNNSLDNLLNDFKLLGTLLFLEDVVTRKGRVVGQVIGRVTNDRWDGAAVGDAIETTSWLVAGKTNEEVIFSNKLAESENALTKEKLCHTTCHVNDTSQNFI